MRRRPSLLVGLLVGSLLACGGSRLPTVLAGLPRTELVTGREAQRLVKTMHEGASTVPERTEIATYASASGAAVVFASTYHRTDDADVALERMAEAMRAGRGPFTMPIRADDGTWRTTGLGQAHAFWTAGCRLVWLQTSPDRLEAAVAELRSRPS